MELSEILEIQPYSLNKTEKEKLLNPIFTGLSQFHYTHCETYKKMMDVLDMIHIRNITIL